MIHSDNPFLIRSEKGVKILQNDPLSWVVEVGENGNFSADFLQTNADLKIQAILSGIGAKCDINCVYLCNDNNKL